MDGRSNKDKSSDRMALRSAFVKGLIGELVKELKMSESEIMRVALIRFYMIVTEQRGEE